MARWLLHACTKLSCWQVTEASEDLGSTQVGLMPGLVWCGSKVAPIQWARHTHLHNLTPRTARPEQSQVDQDNIEHCMAASSIGSCLWQWLRQAKVKREEADRRTKPAPAEVKSMSILRCTRLGCGVGLERILTCAFIVPLLPHGIA